MPWTISCTTSTSCTKAARPNPNPNPNPDQASIQALQKQLAEQSAKVDKLAAQKNNPPAAAPAAAGATEEQLKMQLEFMQKQKELEQLRAAK